MGGEGLLSLLIREGGLGSEVGRGAGKGFTDREGDTGLGTEGNGECVRNKFRDGVRDKP